MTKTNAYSILSVFIRTFAMWIFVAIAVAMAATFHTANAMDPSHKWTFFFIGNGLPMTVAVLIWIFADRLAKLALARPEQIVFESDIAPSEWQAIAFSVVGVWQAFGGIIGLTSHVAGMLAARAQMADVALEPWPPKYVSDLAASSVQLMLGLVLLFGSRGLVGLIRRYRQIGYTRTDASEASDSGEARSTKPDPTPPA